MKKSAKIFASIVIALVILGLTLPMLNVFAQETLQAPLKEVENKVDELAQLKDDSTLSEAEKAAREIEVRKEAIEKILDLSLAETSNLENKLNGLNLSDEQKNIKEKFLEILENTNEYSKQLKETINEEGLTLDGVKKIAQDYKDWRAENYDTYVKKITAFILVFQEKQVLRTANDRLDKIMSDIRKLENAKIIKKTDTSSFVDQAMKNLANAQSSNMNAETLILKVIKKDILETATTSPEILMATSTAEKLLQTSAQEKPSQATSTPAVKVISDEDKVQSLVEKSLLDIKNAYGNFLSISVKVSQKLKLK